MAAEAELGRRTAAVTGASRGIGAAIAVALAQEHDVVVALGRDRAALERTARAITDAGAESMAVVCDLTDSAAVAEAFRRSGHVNDCVDTLVNAAGIFTAKPFLACTDADWQDHLDVNVLGAVRATRACLPSMIERRSGRIINVASTAGVKGSRWQSPYNASKHALIGLTRCLALETAAQGIRVNAVCPGFVDTELLAEPGFLDLHDLRDRPIGATLGKRVPSGRLVTAEEVAATCAFLASPAGDAITGQTFVIDGGATA